MGGMIHVAVKVKWPRNTVRAGKAEEREGGGVEINCDVINTMFEAFWDISAWDVMTQVKRDFEGARCAEMGGSEAGGSNI
ncbi:hypothetical protein Acr_00g0070080 [Actinidia rufa]|uniref:Uncharacterized protein n=1 Tax=Actinidia rufa TaxID=165716 RepID=A0A7J0DRP0_9ERIC|nr:hypothetical protein Acr_00g0070080 [Actinidia rufa]